MSTPQGTLKPSSASFRIYIDEVVRPRLSAQVTRVQVSVLIDLMSYLEQQRYDFSGGRAFQTRPVSNAAIAARFSVTIRSARRWLAHLEALGLIAREYRKNPRHRYKNLLNRVRLKGFWEWFEARREKTPDNQCPPKKKDLKYKSITAEKSDQEKTSGPFPASGAITYDTFWADLARLNLPGGRSRPCMNRVAEKFRGNLRRHGIGFNDSSVKKRWVNFCKAAAPVR
ncbi:hypothetical protein [Roseinatronobacter alkalisoli]|uniref:Helix-turn-helix domain-containing protein n=1 Tax=Roseinatronobacter alkalisoli TaxID=3028235 RepID=A0ABT5TA75_9RHOB|nr:hypothetical protein [Roseinatronobacter sp. HJB301]MDD7971997.1 hypothetical protein [Roseinatronobacter sp. HJB301]